MNKRIVVILCCIFLYAPAQRLATKKIIVFIHGSLGAGLIFLNPHRALYDKFLETSYYTQMIKRIRESPLLLQDQVMLDLGLQEISPTLIHDFHTNALVGEARKKAAHYVIGAFDSCMQWCESQKDYSYYTFGHYGLLSQKYRKEVAFELYDALCEQKARYQKDYEAVEIDIIAHSHGGNIALNLYEAESLYQRGITITTLFLLGMPIQHETALYAYTDFFQRVINCYSDGDYIQGKDWVSTKYRRSYKTFKKIGHPSTKKVIDVRLLINNKRKRIGHANMWLMGRARKACNALGNLPLVVLAPCIMQLSEGNQDSHYDCHIHEDGNTLQIGLTGYKQNGIQLTCFDGADYMKKRINSWAPEDRSRHPFFNKKLLEVIKNLFKVWI